MRFKTIREIGRGSYGVVYLARDTLKGNYVALKRLRPDPDGPSPERDLLLVQEVLLAQKVSHPCVCRVNDIFIEDGVVEISMEYIEGENLRAFIKRKRLRWNEALAILMPVLDGLEEAHRKGVVHRDLKPENILIGVDGAVKITDFGLARMADANRTVSRSGTPGYMAPEQVVHGTADARSDIYALGMILHEMLSGERTLESHPALPKNVLAYVASVIWRCLEGDPSKRFQSVAELRLALTEPPVPRRRVHTAVLAVGLAIVVTIIVAVWRFSTPSRVDAGVKTAGVNGNTPPASTSNPVPDSKTQASKALSDGIYFLQKDLAGDALASFDHALELDGDWSDAHFQRGLALVKLKRWDDAIAAFKRALPGSADERREIWSWSSSFPAGSKHGLVLAARKRVIYAEQKGKATVLHIVDPEQHNVRRLEILDDTVRLNAPNASAWANDRVSVVMAVDVRLSANPGRIGLYGISAADGSLLWHNELEDSGSELPLIALTPDAVLTYLPHKRLLMLLDDQTGKTLWSRSDLTIDRRVSLVVRNNLVLVKAQDDYRAIRTSDGADVWTVGVPDFAENIAPSIDGNTMVFVSKSFDAGAVEIGASTGSLLWQKPINKRLTSIMARDGQLFAATTDGEWIVMDVKTGTTVSTTQAARSAINVDYAAGDMQIASSPTAVYRLGSRPWQYASGFPAKAVNYFNGIVTLRTSADRFTALDAESGAVVGQYTTAPLWPQSIAMKDSFLLVDDSAVNEYSIGKSTTNVTNKTVLTEAASALIDKGDLDDAAVFVEKAAHDIDPDYPRLRLVRARLLLAQEKAKGHAPPLQAGNELADYAALAGRESEAARDAIAEMNRGFGLSWNQATETVAPGNLEIVDGRLINGGTAKGTAQILALNPDTGEVVWRQPFQRFVDSVVVKSTVFFVSGNSNDPAAVVLNRVDVARGERHEVASWNRPSPVDQARVAYAAGRLFVETISRDAQTSRVQVGLDCFDATSGVRLWQQNHEIEATRLLQRVPAALFMPQADALVYSVGQEILTVRGADGTEIDRQHVDHVIGDNVSHSAVPPGPIYFVTDQMEIFAYDPVRKTMTSSPRPEIDSSQLTMRGNVLFGTDKGSLFRFDVGTGVKWTIAPAGKTKFISLRDDGRNLWAMRDDNVLFAIDPTSGKTLREYSTLWRPAGYNIIGNRLYAGTADGFAFAIQLSR